MAESFVLSQFIEDIDFVREKHGNQIRKFSYAPYYTHPISVACLVMKYKASHKIDHLVRAALGHDLFEDTDTTEQEIEERWGWQVLSLIQELTSNDEEVKAIGKTAYLSNKMVTMSSWGLVIKLCDRLHNVMDFIFATPKFVSKYRTETITIIEELYLRRELSDTHIKIIEAIRRQLEIY
jgi:(p)ppGpp synthase/HD superfamily hydrolase